MADCTHDCSTCSSNCSSRDKASFVKPLHEGASVKKTIAVASGKGGVGKSLVTSLLAVRAMARGYRTAILDADITGPRRSAQSYAPRGMRASSIPCAP